MLDFWKGTGEDEGGRKRNFGKLDEDTRCVRKWKISMPTKSCFIFDSVVVEKRINCLSTSPPTMTTSSLQRLTSSAQLRPNAPGLETTNEYLSDFVRISSCGGCYTTISSISPSSRTACHHSRNTVPVLSCARGALSVHSTRMELLIRCPSDSA